MAWSCRFHYTNPGEPGRGIKSGRIPLLGMHDNPLQEDIFTCQKHAIHIAGQKALAYCAALRPKARWYNLDQMIRSASDS